MRFAIMRYVGTSAELNILYNEMYLIYNHHLVNVHKCADFVPFVPKQLFTNLLNGYCIADTFVLMRHPPRYPGILLPKNSIRKEIVSPSNLPSLPANIQPGILSGQLPSPSDVP